MKTMTEAQRQKALKQANDLTDMLDPVFERGDIDEENTKWRNEIINAQILSVEWALRRANHPNQLELEV